MNTPAFSAAYPRTEEPISEAAPEVNVIDREIVDAVYNSAADANDASSVIRLSSSGSKKEVETSTCSSNYYEASNDYELPFLPIETEHDWNDGVVTKAPTCTQTGVRTYTCRYNSSHTYTEVIPATGHDWDDGVITTLASCTHTGIKTYTCKNNPTHRYTEEIPAAEHTPAESITEDEIAATCCTEGSYDEVVYCSFCGEEISRTHRTTSVDEDAHDWGEWVLTKEPTATEAGEETRTCANDPTHTQTREIPATGPDETELSFIDGEIVIVVMRGAVPDGYEFDVQKIVPPPAEAVEKIQGQHGSNATVPAYYQIRLTDGDGGAITRLDGEITIKTKMPERYVGNKNVRLLQEDENGELILMESWWEEEYICYNTDWLEIYD